eukprot:TRINITY_DN3951_c0_g1_i1.p1 TRINITY_DN3951_c0_g1~~TRINITY_DN3951_c0_g1_i1.p1  ORF type:complete len:474 (-),score=66.14 TRINITY_DN3951_c0_g1_i1:117-1538(-)
MAHRLGLDEDDLLDVELVSESDQMVEASSERSNSSSWRSLTAALVVGVAILCTIGFMWVSKTRTVSSNFNEVTELAEEADDTWEGLLSGDALNQLKESGELASSTRFSSSSSSVQSPAPTPETTTSTTFTPTPTPTTLSPAPPPPPSPSTTTPTTTTTFASTTRLATTQPPATTTTTTPAPSSFASAPVPATTVTPSPSAIPATSSSASAPAPTATAVTPATPAISAAPATLVTAAGAETPSSVLQLAAEFQAEAAQYPETSAKYLHLMNISEMLKAGAAKLAATPAPSSVTVAPQTTTVTDDPLESPLAPHEQVGDGNSCPDDEEQFAEVCYKKCSLLTGGSHPIRTSPFSCCTGKPCGFSNTWTHMGMCFGYDVAGDSVAATEGKCPHGGGACLTDEEEFAGMCYKKCSDLTNSQYPHRTAASTCCKTVGWRCFLFSNVKTDSTYALGGGAGDGNSGTPSSGHMPLTALTR